MFRTLPALAGTLALTLTSACATVQKPLDDSTMSQVADSKAGIISMEVTTEIKAKVGYPRVTIEALNIHTGESTTLELAEGSNKPTLKSFALKPGHYRFLSADIESFPMKQGQWHIAGVKLTLVKDLLALPEFDIVQGETTRLSKALVFRLSDQHTGQGYYRVTGHLTTLDPLAVLQQASTKE